MRMSRFLLLTLPKSKLWSHHTLNEAFRRIVWSLNALDTGLHPVAGPYGEELPEHLQKLANTKITSCQTCFSVTEVRGDWSWLKNELLRFRASWNGRDTCFHCAARSVGPMSDRYYNFESGSWIDRNFTLSQFIARQMPSEGVSA